jgi:hypothetical protein
MNDELASYRAAWAFWVAAETKGEQADPFLDSVIEEFGEDEIISGLMLVATRLRQALLDHAQGCDCGSDQWLEQVRLAECS